MRARPPDSARKDIGDYPILDSFYRVYRYHAGSMAMGSALLAVTTTLRLILFYVEQNTKKLQESNKFVKYLIIVSGVAVRATRSEFCGGGEGGVRATNVGGARSAVRHANMLCCCAP